MKALRILMIHPGAKIGEVVSSILEKAGHAVAGAADGTAVCSSAYVLRSS